MKDADCSLVDNLIAKKAVPKTEQNYLKDRLYKLAITIGTSLETFQFKLNKVPLRTTITK